MLNNPSPTLGEKKSKNIMVCSDGFPLHNLEYTSYPRSSPAESCGTMLPMLVAIVVVAMILMRTPPMHHINQYVPASGPSARVVSAVSEFGSDMSARLSTVGETVLSKVEETLGTKLNDAHHNPFLTKMISARHAVPAENSKSTSAIPKNSGIKLFDCKGCVENANAWESMTVEEKSEVEAEVRAMISSEKRVVIMFFAPWCTHCHSAMPIFAKLKSSAEAAKVKLVMINTMALPDAAFQDGMDKPAIYKLQYFPTFVYKSGGELKEVPMGSLHTAIEQYGPWTSMSARVGNMIFDRKSTTDANTRTPPNPSPPPVVAKKETEDIFRDLF